MKIGLINIGIGNLHSLCKFLNYNKNNYILIENEREFERCDKIIIPGQGSFNYSIKQIENSFLKNSIKNHVNKGKYILGICLGMQLFMDKGYENSINLGLGIIRGEVIKLDTNLNIKPIPHIGWNKVYSNHSSNIEDKFKTTLENNFFYFAHSYYCNLEIDNNCMFTEYDQLRFVSFYNKDNVFGTQFHPELSGDKGYSFLKEFINL